MVKHKLGANGVLHENPDGTIALIELGRFTSAFRVPLASVVGFTEARDKGMTATLSVLGEGGVIATCRTNYGTADKLNQWLASRRPPSRPAVATPAAPAPDLLGDLERLAALHERGALTDAEFAAAKARLLG